MDIIEPEENRRRISVQEDKLPCLRIKVQYRKFANFEMGEQLQTFWRRRFNAL